MENKIGKTLNLELVGVDSNAFALMGIFRRQAKKEGWSNEEIDLVLEDAMSDDYNHLLTTIMTYCEPRDSEDGQLEI